MPSVFITGAAGCVGHYLVDELAPDYDLYLLVRDPRKLLFDARARAHVTIVKGDLRDIAEHADLLRRMDYCIHVATCWGGPEAAHINVQATHDLLGLLDVDRVRRVIYFSTASILGRDMRPLPQAGLYGTEYIRSKYQCYMSLPEQSLHGRIVTVFPTLVFGGDESHPMSHVSSGLPRFRRLAWLLGRIGVEARFHYVHAEDIARMVKWILEAPELGRSDYVLGNSPVSLGEFLRRAANAMGCHIRAQIPFSVPGLYRLARTLGAQMSKWDAFCVEYKDFVYDATSCASLGLPSTHATVEGIAGDWRAIADAQWKRSKGPKGPQSR